MDADGRDLRSDEALLVAIGDADRGALTVLYHRHAAWLTVRLAHRCSDSDVVDLALHDTFMSVWRKPGSYRGSGEVAAWLWGIAVRRLLDQLRRRPALAYLPTIEQWVVSAEDEVLVGLHHSELAGALDRLSPELLSVVQATVLDGLSTREAAKLLRIPTGTVKSRNARARAHWTDPRTPTSALAAELGLAGTGTTTTPSNATCP